MTDSRVAAALDLDGTVNTRDLGGITRHVRTVTEARSGDEK